jgi:excisionase family DNA binding protein
LEAAGLPKTLMTVAEASQVSRCVEGTIRQWVRDGVIHAWSTPWGVSRYLVDITEILKPVAASGKRSPIRYTHNEDTREKIRAKAKLRWAYMKEQMAQRQADAAPSEPLASAPPEK